MENTQTEFEIKDLASIKTETENNMTSISQLNYDCLVQIFQYLPFCDRVRCERVCKLWQSASRKSWYNCKKLDLDEKSWGNNQEADVYFSYLDKVLSRCSESITHIDLSNRSDKLRKRPQKLSILAKCLNLRELNLIGVKIGKSQIRSIGNQCQKIEKLKLSDITHFCDDKFLDENLFSKLNLKCLHFTGYSKLKGSWLKHLSHDLVEEISLDNCHFGHDLLISTLPTYKNLYSLHLRRAWHYFEILTASDLFKGLSKLQNLKVLDFFGSPINDNDIIELSPLRDRLTTLIVGNKSGVHHITDTGLSVILSLSSIEHLTIRNCRRVTGVCLTNVYNLKTLDCGICKRMNEKNLITLMNNSKRLNYLDLSLCKRIKLSFVESTMNLVNYRKNSNKMRINLHGTQICKNSILNVGPLVEFEFEKKN